MLIALLASLLGVLLALYQNPLPDIKWGVPCVGIVLVSSTWFWGRRYGQKRFFSALSLGLISSLVAFSWTVFCGNQFMQAANDLQGEQSWSVEIVDILKSTPGFTRIKLRLLCRAEETRDILYKPIADEDLSYEEIGRQCEPLPTITTDYFAIVTVHRNHP